LGNSPDDYFIGPEAPGIAPNEGLSYKDSEGRIKRQAARFRLFGFDDKERAVRELTLDSPDVEAIEWRVSLANRKAEWWRFAGAERVRAIVERNPELFLSSLGVKDYRVLGLAPDDVAVVETDAVLRARLVGIAGKLRPEHAEVARALRRMVRNTDVRTDREGLEIVPPTRSISGRNQGPVILDARFTVPGVGTANVTLGALRTDAAGRLLVLGGFGVSESLVDENPLSHYANNDAWHDDTSDGSIEADVRMKGGATQQARGRAWVIVAPPHYSPHTQNVVTLYDVMSEAARVNKLPNAPALPDKISFTKDIFPILARHAGYQWVTARAMRGHAVGGPGDFTSEGVLARLADPVEAARPGSLHKLILGRVRRPIVHPSYSVTFPDGFQQLPPDGLEASAEANLGFMPPLAGDEGDVEMGNPETWLSVTATQYRALKLWSDGNFENDWKGTPRPTAFDELAVPDQPHALTRAALEVCQGGAFFPGIEATSIVRFRSFYSDAFRVSVEYRPGDITKWMALPWQADFFECREHWWPTIRPDDTVPERAFDEISTRLGNKDAAEIERFLRTRRPWTQGLGVAIPARPALPQPLSSDSGPVYAARCEARRGAYLSRYISAFDGLRPDKLSSMTRYRVEVSEFLERTIDAPPYSTGFKLPDPEDNEAPSDYHDRIMAALRTAVGELTKLPDLRDGETAAAYGVRLDTSSSAWNGILDTEWRFRVINNGKTELVAKWWRLGIVVSRRLGDRTYLVESERDPYNPISFRDAFYYLMNIEAYPDFRKRAFELAEEYFAKAGDFGAQIPSIREVSYYALFEYSETALDAWLSRIYDSERQKALAYDPATAEQEPYFRTPEQVVERIRQLAPFNQLDGSWLERAVKAGPIADISSFLFEIWGDEVGNGDPAKNHANVYGDLLHSAGIYLPPLDSRAYADHRGFWEGSFSSPVYQTSAAQFPEAFFPELLGMTLYLEWEAIYLPAMVKLYDYHGYSSLFYRLHVAIDNAVEGHGARARQAAVRYLENVRAESGPAGMQEHWRRIWIGYLAFKFIGDSEWEYRLTNPDSVDDRMLAMLGLKRPFAQLNHGTRRFGANMLNDWFDEPDQFLAMLADSDLVVRGDPDRSAIFSLMAPTGQMYKVFTADDIALWKDWIRSMTPDTVPGGDAATAMVRLVTRFAARAIGVPEHAEFELEGMFRGARVRKPVAWWFALGEPTTILAAITDPANGLVQPGDPLHSRLVTEFLSGPRRMARQLQRASPDFGFERTGPRSARLVIVDWIRNLPPTPAQRLAAAPAALVAKAPQATRSAPRARSIISSDYAKEIALRTRRSHAISPVAARRRRLGPGGGAPH
jgi:hypothetical protein